MKPQIAISMSRDGIEVLRRMADGWRNTSLIPLSDPEFSARVRAAHAEAQAAGGGRDASDPSKLIIPGTEILYTSVHAPGPEDSDRQEQIGRAIDGMTPYGVDELVFDWCGIGDDLQVAVVARDTLQEAEGFAAEHGIDAVAFVAAPGPDQFMGEVYFGRTQMAARLLPKGAVIERDLAPVQSVGALADAPPPAASAAAPETPAASGDDAGQGSAAPSDPPAKAASAKAPSAKDSDAAPEKPIAEPKTDTPKDRAGKSKRNKSKGPSKPPVKDKVTPPASLLPWLSKGKGSAEPAEPEPVAQFSSRRPAVAATGAGAPDAPSAAPATPPVPAAAESAAPAPSALARLGGLGRKLVPSRAPETPAAEAGTDPAALGAADPATGKLLGRARALLKRTEGASAAKRPPAADPAPEPKPASPKPPPAQSDTRAPAAAGSLGGPELKEALAAPVRNLADKPGRGTPSADAVGTEAEKLTIFGARGNVPAERGFLGRGLLLTGALILALAAVAVWAVFFIRDPETGVQLPTTAPSPAEDQAAAPLPLDQDTDAPVFDEEAQIDAALAELESAMDTGSTEEAAPAAPEAETAGEGPAAGVGMAEPAGTAMPEAEAFLDGGATDGSDALQTTPEVSGMEPFALSSLTPPSSAAAQMPEAPMAPAPFGTEDIPGMLSSPDFAPPPEVIDGRPAAVPPQRPEGLAPEEPAPDQDAQLTPAPSGDDIQLAALPVESTSAAAAPRDDAVLQQAPTETATAETTTETATETAVAPDATPDNDTAAQRASLLPEEETDTPSAARAALEATALAQGIALFTEAAPEFDGLRPAARPAALEVPQSVLTQAEATTDALAEDTASEDTASEDTASEDIAQAAADAPDVSATPGGLVLTALRPAARPDDLVTRPAEAAPAPIESDNPLAVASSLRPNERPDGFSRRVQQAIAAAQSAPRQQAAPTPSATPSIPTSASVAREATQTRAINLRQLNLIGVFGTSANRTALVRLSNGRIERVRVGDRLDRGQVTAIGNSELVYQRSGRTHRLRIAERG